MYGRGNFRMSGLKLLSLANENLFSLIQFSIFRLKIENCIRKHRFLYARRGIYYYGIKKETAQCSLFFYTDMLGISLLISCSS